MRACVVIVMCAADGSKTTHDGKYVVAWNPHTKAGHLEVVTTAHLERARRFDHRTCMEEWRTVSRVEPVRPWDGRPNRPLTGITIDVITVNE